MCNENVILLKYFQSNDILTKGWNKDIFQEVKKNLGNIIINIMKTDSDVPSISFCSYKNLFE